MMKRCYQGVLYGLLLIVVIYQSNSAHCGFDLLQAKEVKEIKANSRRKNRQLDESIYESIRIYIDELQYTGDISVSEEEKEYTKHILNKTARSLEQLIKVIRLTEPLGVDYDTCGSLLLSKKVQQGVDADLIILPMLNSKLNSSVLASASHCHGDKDTKRPLVGYLTINANIVSMKPNLGHYLQMIFLHEMTHILVFSPALFPYFIKPDGTFYGNQATEQSEINGIKRLKIITPNVVAAARKHFGCRTIDGVELENQGGSGSVGSHWESRVMLGDYMISSNYAESVISDITLALFEDSGWYKVNRYTGGLFRFGKNQGCKFFDSKCIEDSLPLTNNDFCNIPNQSRCLAGRTAKGSCIMKKGLTIAAEYEYFTDKSKGGFLSADYCPVSYSKKNSLYQLSSSCKYGLKDESLEEEGEVIGDSSVCMISSLKKRIGSNHQKAICLPVNCSKNKLTVFIGKTQYDCPIEGGMVKVPGYEGELYCPDYNLVCSGSHWCNDPIECIEKASALKSIEYDYIAKHSQLEGIAHSQYQSNGIMLQMLICFIMIV